MTVPAFINKEHILEIQDTEELSINWSGWNPSYDNARRRRIIKRRIDESGFGMNTYHINKDMLVAHDLLNSGYDFDRDIVVHGIGFARAYYDATNNTGEIFVGKPVVFDTVTAECITGINETWDASEYTVVGISLVDYSETTVGGEDIPIKLFGSEKKKFGDIVVRIPSSGIPARGGLMFHGVKCPAYSINELVASPTGTCQLFPTIKDSLPYEVMTYNISNSAIKPNVYATASELLMSPDEDESRSIWYVVVESCFGEVS